VREVGHIPLVPVLFTWAEQVLWELPARWTAHQAVVLGRDFGSAMQMVAFEHTGTAKTHLNSRLAESGLHLNSTHGLLIAWMHRDLCSWLLIPRLNLELLAG